MPPLDGPFTVTCIRVIRDGKFIVTAEAEIGNTTIIGPFDMFCNASNGAGHKDNDSATVTVQGIILSKYQYTPCQCLVTIQITYMYDGYFFKHKV